MRIAVPVNSLSGFLAEIECVQHERGNVVFRGQAHTWPLCPKIGRKLYQQEIESEQEYLQKFVRQAHPFSSIKDLDLWEQLALAQHHGLPTRLLDWTKNPLVALWFALNEFQSDREWTPVVWVLSSVSYFDKAKDTPFSIRRTSVYEPAHITPRISAQSGLFTVHRRIERLGKYIPLEENKSYADFISPVFVEPSSVPVMLESLKSCGIHYASMFPGLDGIAKSMLTNNSNV